VFILTVAAGLGYDAIADGTRRDDRVPTVDRSLAQSIEDRHGVAHLAPLAGVGRTAVDALVADSLVVESGPSEAVPKGDYESELRALTAPTWSRRCFPSISSHGSSAGREPPNGTASHRN
jgi:predicted subunit of tRNA(5-methylaminomethyl-2-thiouridylate) methyltransferase